MTGLSKIAMVVGSNDATRIQFARWLAGFGIDSVHVATESEALALLSGMAPDLIVLTEAGDRDAMLSVVAQASKLRRQGGTRVMLCTGAGDVGILSAAVAEGADECMVAPFDADILKFKLEQTGVLVLQ